MPVTQQDIAKRVNVSRSLVGKVLSGRSGDWVSPETKRLILSTARELNYQANASARMLRHGKSNSVGLFGVQHPDASLSDFEGGIPSSICAHVLAAAGFDLKVKVFSNVESLFAGLKEAACGGLCDAFIVSGVQTRQQGELLEMLGVPFAVYGSFEQSHPHWFQVDFDHYEMMSMAVRSLAEHGKGLPAMLCYQGENDFNDRLIGGFEKACRFHYGQNACVDMIVRIAADEQAARVVTEHFDRWMTRPQSQRPDSIVMAVETRALAHVEEQIWRYGKLIGFKPDQFGMSGACREGYDWLNGDFSTFERLDATAVARALTKDIIVPLLRGEKVARPIIRVVPQMYDCIGLRSHGLENLAKVLAKS